MSLSVLITNVILGSRTGTEILVRNTAMALRRRGIDCVVYSPMGGPIAEEIRMAGVPVASDIRDIQRSFDVIHGHHTPTTAAAIARFPDVPALFFCHDVTTWHDTPPKLPTIRRYVAVDDATADRMRSESGIAGDRMRVMLNAVALDRFLPGPPLPLRPRRALVFAKNYGDLSAISEACATRGIAVEAVGAGVGKVLDRPDLAMPAHDVVFASAMTAMEAMACGRAVVVCDGRGFAGLATPDNFERWRRLNFGLRTFTGPIAAAAVGAALDAWDPSASAEVTRRIRESADFEKHVDALVELYREVIAEHRADPPRRDEQAIAMAGYVGDWAPRIGPAWPWMLDRASLVDRVEELLAANRRSAVEAEDARAAAAASDARLARAAKIAALEPAPIGVPLRFGEGRSSAWQVATAGFSRPESWGCWTDGERAAFVFRTGSRSDLVAKFRLRAFLVAAHPTLEVDVAIGDATTTTWRFALPSDVAFHERTLRIPRHESDRDGTIRLTFAIRHPKAPAELGAGEDHRSLGLGLAAMKLKRAWW